jgi:phospholipase/carboxylesterase
VDVPGLTAARRAILQLMYEVAEGVDAERIYLCGHSQGAALALAIAVTEPERVAGVVAISGRVVPEVMPDAAEPARTAGLPVLLVHGTHDPVVPVMHARTARTLLAERGARVTYREHDAEHGVSREMVADVNDWLDAEPARPR